jgi:hypothetical protein
MQRAAFCVVRTSGVRGSISPEGRVGLPGRHATFTYYSHQQCATPQAQSFPEQLLYGSSVSYCRITASNQLCTCIGAWTIDTKMKRLVW